MGGGQISRGREQSEARVAANAITARDIEPELRQRVDSLVPELLGGARREGGFWCAGSTAGEAGQSLKVNRTGPRIGLWTDFSAATGSDVHSGDMLKLIAVVKFGGWSNPLSRAPAIAWAKSWLGWDDLDPNRLATVRRESAVRQAKGEQEAERQQAGKLRSAAALWHGSVPIRGTPAEAYLRGRGIDFDRLGRMPASLRYRPDAWCPERRAKHPAMIACIMALSGALAGVHRTYLDVSKGKGGAVGKAGVANAKLSLGFYQGGCIPLWKGACAKTLREIDAGVPVYASEGIEDGLSVALTAPDQRVVAGVALANLGGLELPPQAGALVLIGQNDPVGSKAQEAFERAIARQQAAGRKVQLMFPPPEYKDFNDQLMGKRMGVPA